MYSCIFINCISERIKKQMLTVVDSMKWWAEISEERHTYVFSLCAFIIHEKERGSEGREASYSLECF